MTALIIIIIAAAAASTTTTTTTTTMWQRFSGWSAEIEMGFNIQPTMTVTPGFACALKTNKQKNSKL